MAENQESTQADACPSSVSQQKSVQITFYRPTFSLTTPSTVMVTGLCNPDKEENTMSRECLDEIIEECRGLQLNQPKITIVWRIANDATATRRSSFLVEEHQREDVIFGQRDSEFVREVEARPTRVDTYTVWATGKPNESEAEEARERARREREQREAERKREILAEHEAKKKANLQTSQPQTNTGNNTN